MGAEVLYTQDFLANRDLGSPSSASFSHLRRQSCRASLVRNPKLRRRRGERIAEAKAGDDSSALPIVGQVKILKRGEPLKTSDKGENRLRTPGKIRSREEMKLSAFLKGDVYAGSAFTQSPSPRALPLPKFSSRREDEEEEVDRSATKDLLRLLRLE